MQALSRRVLASCGQRGRRRLSCSRPAAEERREVHTCQAAVLSDAATHEESAPVSARPGSVDAGAAAAAAAAPHARIRLVVSPDDLVLEPGELSVVDRPGCDSPADVFRCPSCTELACQVLASYFSASLISEAAATAAAAAWCVCPAVPVARRQLIRFFGRTCKCLSNWPFLPGYCKPVSWFLQAFVPVPHGLQRLGSWLLMPLASCLLQQLKSAARSASSCWNCGS